MTAKPEDFDRFANEVAQWLIEKYGEYQDPMMMGGMPKKKKMMRGGMAKKKK